MRKYIYALLPVAIVSIGACKKNVSYFCTVPCSTCAKVNQSDELVCANNFSSNTTYNAAINDYEAQGYTCTDTIKTKGATGEAEREAVELEGYECISE